MGWIDVFIPLLIAIAATLLGAGLLRVRNLFALRVSTALPSLIFLIWFVLRIPAQNWDVGFGIDRQFFWDPAIGIPLFALWAAFVFWVEGSEWLSLGGLLLTCVSSSPWVVALGFTLCWFARTIESPPVSVVQLLRPLLATFVFAGAAILPAESGREWLVCAGVLALAEAEDQRRKLRRMDRVLGLFTAVAGLRLLASVRGSVGFEDPMPLGIGIVCACVAFRALFSQRSFSETILASGAVWILNGSVESAGELSTLFALLGVFGMSIAALASVYSGALAQGVIAVLGAWVLAGGWGVPLVDHWAKAFGQFGDDPWRLVALGCASTALVWSYFREVEMRKQDRVEGRRAEVWRAGAGLLTLAALIFQARAVVWEPVYWIPVAVVLVIGLLAWQLDLRWGGLSRLEKMLSHTQSRVATRSAQVLHGVIALEPKNYGQEKFDQFLIAVRNAAGRVAALTPVVEESRMLGFHKSAGRFFSRAFFSQAAWEVLLALVLIGVLFWGWLIQGMS